MISVRIADLDAIGIIPRSQLDLLDTSEEERSKNIRMPGDRRRFLMGRILLRRALSEIMGGDPRSWKFILGQTGKVNLAHLRPGEGLVDFSISHSEGAVVVAISNSMKVGIDVEYLDAARMQHPLQGVFSDGEISYLANRRSGARTWETLRLWTLKEAYSKLLGLGTQVEFSELDLFNADSGVSLRSKRVTLSGKSYCVGIACQTAKARWPDIEIRALNIGTQENHANRLSCVSH